MQKFVKYKNPLVLVLSISLLLCTRLHAQDIGTYRKMLKIVQKHNGGKVILVSDEIPYIDLGGFSDTISKLWHKSVFGAIGEMDSLSRTSPRMLYNRQLLQMSARKGKYSEVLYFGNIYKGLVIAELITVKEKTDYLTHLKRVSIRAYNIYF